MTKKSLLAKYQPLVDAEVSPVEAKNNITEAEKDLMPEQVDELIEALYDIEPAPTRKAELTPDKEEEHGNPMLKGKRFYNILRGKWIPLEAITGPDGKEIVVLWEFEKEGKPTRTGVPMEPDRAKAFNNARQLRSVNTYTEQMVLVGDESPIYDELPDPNKRRRLNS